ncbi:acetoacetate--CoA ligase [Mycolicibacter algericus]|uniref:Acetoacetate-CoA ligase n=2 Tax=Mycolicibacter algericus TaxID=1288388 RepID=A0A7I9YAG4_MYCAL|nr:acetoacetate--CoA ligase [Mycolicibacter algericus]OQZ94044.1 acetoacetate--CoA ligase [Mycolicibacter algericus DSM 45454]GFG85594.1 acetoacetate-CoA ligase [Mycolicibacter algericus]
MLVDDSRPTLPRRDDIVWTPSAAVRRDCGLTAYLEWLGIKTGRHFSSYQALWQWSVNELDEFWKSIDGFEGLGLGEGGRPALAAAAMPGAQWFPGASINYAEEIFRRAPDSKEHAFICISEDSTTRISWDEFRRRVGSLAARLRNWGVRKGDCVAGYLPNTSEAIVAFIACASIGAIWSVCSPEFGTAAVLNRFGQLRPKVLIGATEYRYGGKPRNRVQELCHIASSLNTVERVVAVGGIDVDDLDRAVTDWPEAISGDEPIEFEQVEFDHPLWVLFSSGTTGLPKGIVHGHGGIVVEHLKTLRLHCDLRAADRLLFVGSTSWMVWNLMVSGLLIGATLVVVDGSPVHPDLDRIWRLVAEERVAVLGLGAGLIKSYMAAGRRPGQTFDLSGLRTLTVTGSPLGSEGFFWVRDNVNADAWLASCSGGTDICSAFVGGVPLLPVRAGRIQAPSLGVAAASWSPDGKPVIGEPGELVVTKPMPSMPLYFWDDPDGKRYRDSYFRMYPGTWRHGDFIEFDTDASSIIHGRSDSTLNRHGIRMGSAEIYSAVEKLPDVVEALIVGAELDSQYYVPLFVHLRAGVDPQFAKRSIETAIRTDLSPRHLPDEIVVMPGIPHNRIGKKLEVPVKRMLQGSQLVQTVDPGSVDDIDLLRQYEQFARLRASQSTQSANAGR